MDEDILSIVDKIVGNNYKDEILRIIDFLLNSKKMSYPEMKEKMCQEWKSSSRDFNTYGLKDIKIKLKVVPGNYVVFDTFGRIVYVGETDNLARMMLGDLRASRLSRGTPVNKFIGYLMDKKSTIDHNQIQNVLNNEYLFTYAGSSSKEMAFMIAGILKRRFKGQLWNKPKKYHSSYNI